MIRCVRIHPEEKDKRIVDQDEYHKLNALYLPAISMSINLKSSFDRADSLDWLRDESFRDWTAFNDEQHVLSRWIQKCSLKMEVNSPYEYLKHESKKVYR